MISNNIKKSDTRFGTKDLVILLFMAAIAAWRILISAGSTEISGMSNFSPLGAMALFGGAFFTRGKALLFPLLTLWISDVILGRLVFYGEWILFYDGFFWVYGAFALMAVAGRYLKPQTSAGRFTGSALSIVLIHWIVTDIGVWLSGTTYPMTAEGLWLCLLAAIPFEINLLAGTFLYGAVLFGGYAWIKRRVPGLQAV